MRVEKDSVHMGNFLEVFYHFFTLFDCTINSKVQVSPQLFVEH